MEISVLWSDSARSELRSIHDYFLNEVSLKIARKTTHSIVAKSMMLSDTPRMGQVEELFSHRKEEIRYLIEGNYKIVYLIDEPIILILSVFDYRQDPKKLKKKKF